MIEAYFLLIAILFGGYIALYVLAFLISGILGFFLDSKTSESSESPAAPRTYPRPFGLKIFYEDRKQEYKQGNAKPGWFDKISLWVEGNNENNR